MPSTINNKKILLLAPKFYFYHAEIIKSLESLGAKVTFYPEMEYSLFYRLIKKISHSTEKLLAERYMRRVLAEVSLNTYDIIFVIRGCALTPLSLKCMHGFFPNAKFVMYQWDSMRQNNYRSIIEYFDYVYTFDMVDATEYNLAYLPLFYIKTFQKVYKKRKIYDLVFHGAYHSDRLEIVKFFYEKCKKGDFNFKSHLYISKLALLRLVISGCISIKDIKFFKTQVISFNEIVESYRKTFAVLDVELSIQDGLSMRTFEALGSNLKLVTTNGNIKAESFYSSDRIMVIDRKNLNIDVNFFRSNIVDSQDFKEFSIDSWVGKVLCLKY